MGILWPEGHFHTPLASFGTRLTALAGWLRLEAFSSFTAAVQASVSAAFLTGGLQFAIVRRRRWRGLAGTRAGLILLVFGGLHGSTSLLLNSNLILLVRGHYVVKILRVRVE